jgi:hypothetical protein
MQILVLEIQIYFTFGYSHEKSVGTNICADYPVKIKY